MRMTGVICEYNPFHPGHAHHLQMARHLSGADFIVAVMSACFTQRGDAAMLSPALRARMALEGGADIVLALPAMWSLRDAEHFALGGVYILGSIGCDAISFGAETDDLTALTRLATAIENPSPSMLAAIHSRLDAGNSYPAALSSALELLLPQEAELLQSPNNTLGICYLRAIQRLGSPMQAVPVRREGSYHSTVLDVPYPSATAIREAIACGNWAALEEVLPASTLDILHTAAAQGTLMQSDALDQALLYRLRTMTEDEWHALPGATEGIEDRLRKASVTASTRSDLLQAAKTRRYPWARLNRMCTHALLQFDDDLLEDTPLPPAAMLLGFRRDAQPALHRMKESGFPIIAKAADYNRSQPWFAAEERAWDVWALGAGKPAGMLMTEKVVVL